MTTFLRRVILGAAVLLLGSASAHALPITIGSFSLDDDPFFGPFFTVDNFSDAPFSLGPPGASFFDVFVEVTPQGQAPFKVPIAPGIGIGAGASAQSVEPLTNLTILSATLSLNFLLPGTLTFGDLFGIPSNAAISFDPASPPGPPVPEPGTLLLLGTGVAGLTVARGCRRARRRRPGDSSVRPPRSY